ncbi:hypothetical protein IGI04_019186 [Brassica rapa subsp. trilocularis]|uniref:Secreted protein n=1 Tax=Brassica rapa subsp. trilocularis TaxID=1813537 RepID=A0ABQ7MF36_BRACM|nr:hypothetical protein IGI04_019186 [Brassica rapa subsp. trilocularis]
MWSPKLTLLLRLCVVWRPKGHDGYIFQASWSRFVGHGGYARHVKFGQWRWFVPITSTVPARPGELETPVVEGSEQDLQKKRRHDLRTVAASWILGFLFVPGLLRFT